MGLVDTHGIPGFFVGHTDIPNTQWTVYGKVGHIAISVSLLLFLSAASSINKTAEAYSKVNSMPFNHLSKLPLPAYCMPTATNNNSIYEVVPFPRSNDVQAGRWSPVQAGSGSFLKMIE